MEAGDPTRPGGLGISDQAEGARHTLILRGELNLETGPELQRAINELCEARASEIVLELGRLDFIDSSGVRAVADVEQHCRDLGCEFYLNPGRGNIQRLYDLVGGLLKANQPLDQDTSRSRYS